MIEWFPLTTILRPLLSADEVLATVVTVTKVSVTEATVCSILS